MIGELFRFLRNVVNLNRNLAQDAERQRTEGYSIKFEQDGSERSITYQEGNKKVGIDADFDLLNNVTLYANSFRQWNWPDVKELTLEERARVIKRMVQYFSCWGDVKFDKEAYLSLEEFMKELREKE
jgi:hypothetical protein